MIAQIKFWWHTQKARMKNALHSRVLDYKLRHGTAKRGRTKDDTN